MAAFPPKLAVDDKLGVEEGVRRTVTDPVPLLVDPDEEVSEGQGVEVEEGEADKEKTSVALAEMVSVFTLVSLGLSPLGVLAIVRVAVRVAEGDCEGRGGVGVVEEDGVVVGVGTPLPVATPALKVEEGEVKGLGELVGEGVSLAPPTKIEGVVVVEGVGEVDWEGWAGVGEALLDDCPPTPPPLEGVGAEVRVEVELPPPTLDDPVTLGLVERVGATAVGEEEGVGVAQVVALGVPRLEEEKEPLGDGVPLTVVQEVGEADSVGVVEVVVDTVPVALTVGVG